MNQQQFKIVLKNQCVALTGSIATGKSTVAKILHKFKFDVFDADQLSREAVLPGKPALQLILDSFGPQFIGEDGSLNRNLLREFILNSESAKTELELILHPAIESEFLQKIIELNLDSSKKIFFYEAALIHEKNRAGNFKEVWCTHCPSDMQLQRLLGRTFPKVTLNEANALIKSQWPSEKKALASTRIIDTSKSLQNIEDQVALFLDSLNP